MHSIDQRMKNLEGDMQHAHALTHYSTRVIKSDTTTGARRHNDTSSSYRGQQLLSTVQGKRLQVVSLCHLHEEELEHGILPDGSVSGYTFLLEVASSLNTAHTVRRLSLPSELWEDRVDFG